MRIGLYLFILLSILLVLSLLGYYGYRDYHRSFSPIEPTGGNHAVSSEVPRTEEGMLGIFFFVISLCALSLIFGVMGFSSISLLGNSLSIPSSPPLFPPHGLPASPVPFVPSVPSAPPSSSLWGCFLPFLESMETYLGSYWDWEQFCVFLFNPTSSPWSIYYLGDDGSYALDYYFFSEDSEYFPQYDSREAPDFPRPDGEVNLVERPPFLPEVSDVLSDDSLSELSDSSSNPPQGGLNLDEEWDWT